MTDMTEIKEKKETCGEKYILAVENLVYEYGVGTPFAKLAVDDVSFGIRKNRITGIIGHTGSGKSTLVSMFNGLNKPKSGRVLFNGRDIFADKKLLKEIKFKVGLVFQYPEYQLFEETVRKDIAYGPSNMGLSEEAIARRVDEACEFVGIDKSLLDKSPFYLSGGQKRRVAIAGIIAMRPEVLVLDEPASGLDPIGRRSIFDGLVSYRDKTGAAIVIVSHSMEDMAKYAEDILVMANDKLLFKGTRDEVFGNSELLLSNGLDIPEIAKLAVKLREKGLALPENIYTVEGARSAISTLIKEGKFER